MWLILLLMSVLSAKAASKLSFNAGSGGFFTRTLGIGVKTPIEST